MNNLSSSISPLAANFGEVITTVNNDDLSILEPKDLLLRLMTKGALLLRGFSLSDEAFRSLAEGFGGKFVSHGAPHRPTLAGDTSLHLADPGTNEIHLHIELGYLPLPPDLIWFHCIIPPQSGGATTLCDGTVIARELSTQARDMFKAQRLRYSAFWPQTVWSRYFHAETPSEVKAQLQDIEGVTLDFQGNLLLFDYCISALLPTGSGGELSFANSLLHYILDGYEDYVLFEDGSPFPQWLITELQTLGERHTFEIHWQCDDLLIINNHRVLHGRRSHGDPGRKLHVRMQKLAERSV